MKKILSLALAGVMMVSALPVAYASDVAVDIGTQVTVEGTQASQYEVKVPAKLEAGGAAGNVVATGTWKSSETLIVTAENEVEVTNEETGRTTMVPVVFEGINAAGDDLAAMNISKSVSIEKGDILFGTWTGIVEYNVEFKAGKTTSLKWDNYIRVDSYDQDTGVAVMKIDDGGDLANFTVTVTYNDEPVDFQILDAHTFTFVAKELGDYSLNLNSTAGASVSDVLTIS